MPGGLTHVRFAIANGATESNVQDVSEVQILALHMPDDWDAATISFKAKPRFSKQSPGNDVLQLVVDDAGATVSIAVDADQYVVLTGDALDAMAAVAMVQLVASAVQTPAREIVAVCAPATAL